MGILKGLGKTLVYFDDILVGNSNLDECETNLHSKSKFLEVWILVLTLHMGLLVLVGWWCCMLLNGLKIAWGTHGMLVFLASSSVFLAALLAASFSRIPISEAVVFGCQIQDDL